MTDPGPSIESARRTLAAQLKSAGNDEAELDARLLLAAVLDLDLTGMIAQAGRRLTSAEAALLAQYAQRRIAGELRLKRTPQLTFQYDPSVEQGVRMSKLIDDLVTDHDDAEG